MPENLLYYGDNLPILREYVPDASVDLVYLDPPFKSGQDYNVLFKEHGGAPAAAQIQAFEDTWEWSPDAWKIYQEIVESGGRVSQVMQAFWGFLGRSNMMAYLAMMAPRLAELFRVLKPTGSIYLHCDPTASHYLKLLMDAVFGPISYRNEITWQRTNAHSDAKRWADVADTILYYGKTGRVTWNAPRLPYEACYLKSKYRHDDGDGRGMYRLSDITSPHLRPNMVYEWMGHQPPTAGWRYSRETMQRLHDEGRIWYPSSKDKRPQLKRYLSEMKGVVMGCVWTDIPPLNSQAAERLGYPTQKPEALLQRIITASSNEGDTVLDPFCGCGTAISVAQRLGRRWIGIDITQAAIVVIKQRLLTAFEGKAAYRVIGEPVTVQDAEALASEKDRYQFQWWALGLVGARPAPAERKKGADKGIDGRLYFHDEKNGGTKQVILSVKSGGLKPDDVRALDSVVKREKAAIGVLITMEDPTKPMRNEAAEAGYYFSPGWGKKYPRLQILTIEELLCGDEIDMPPRSHTSVTFKKAPRAKEAKTKQAKLFDRESAG
jgi:site-specific DNA-methyltransferase (adenine-specific)